MLNQLTEAEYIFYKAICQNPDCQYPLNQGQEYNNHDAEGHVISGCWEKLEQLKLIKCTGSYKWIPLISLIDLLEAENKRLTEIINKCKCTQ